MSSLQVDDVIKRVRDLPSPSLVVMELLRSFEQPDINIGALAEMVSYDQALTAKTLRLANSSFYGLSRKVATIQLAITVLGFDSVRALVVAAGVTESFPRSAHPRFNLDNFWRHAIGTAVCTKHIAKVVNLNINYAFVCGLLHDIGKMVLVTCFPAQYEKVIEYRNKEDCHLLDAERTILGIDHTLVGRLVCENWKFPVLIQKAVANHHDPEPADMGGMASAVHAANAIVHALDLGCGNDDLVPEISEMAWASLNLSTADLHSIFRNTEKEFEDACQVLVS